MKDLVIPIYVAKCEHKEKLITHDSHFCPLCAAKGGPSRGWMRIRLVGAVRVSMGDDGQICVKPTVRILEGDVGERDA